MHVGDILCLAPSIDILIFLAHALYDFFLPLLSHAKSKLQE